MQKCIVFGSLSAAASVLGFPIFLFSVLSSLWLPLLQRSSEVNRVVYIFCPSILRYFSNSSLRDFETTA